jgi:hypothetical protein
VRHFIVGISANSVDAIKPPFTKYSRLPISLNDVSFTSMTVHMETVYAEDKNVTSFDVSWNRMTVPWIVLTLNVYITGLTKLQHILSLAGQRIRRESANSADASATTVQNIPILRYFAQRRSFTSMTVHMETVYAADKNVTGFDVSWNRTTVPWIVRMPSNVYITGLDEATTYTFWLDKENSAGISETRQCQCNHRTEYSRFSRYFAQRRVLHFHDCGIRVYAEDKNVTGSTFPGNPHGGSLTARTLGVTYTLRD